MTDHKVKIKWDAIDTNTFMYGSRVKFQDGVFFENLLMPSGTIIHVWYMTTRYFQTRNVPTLPILRRKQQYKIEMNIETIPENSVYIKLKFYKRDLSLIEQLVITEPTGTFIYPADAYEYRIELISSAVRSFHYKSMIITEMESKS